ncbi:MAG TPA: hypothetical protein VKU77_37130 [Streptosporangiaceae bacterium]|nr:hypothetical protein [Streptosporangiaceae bacterium]
MTMKVHRGKTIAALAAAASLALSLALATGAVPSQAAPVLASTKVGACLSASELSDLPLTNRHLTERERCNLAVVLRAYHDGEGTSLDPQGFRDLFAADGVLNGIGDVVSIELSIQGTFLGPFQTPAGVIKPTGAKIDFPTADFWYLRHGKVEVFDCHIAFTTLYAQLGTLPDYASAVGKALSHPARELVHVEIVPPGVDLAVADLEGAHDRQLTGSCGMLW